MAACGAMFLAANGATFLLDESSHHRKCDAQPDYLFLVLPPGIVFSASPLAFLFGPEKRPPKKETSFSEDLVFREGCLDRL